MKRNLKTIYIAEDVDFQSLINEAARNLEEKGYRIHNYLRRTEQSDSAVILAAIMFAAGVRPDGKKGEQKSEN